jgi:hypothetical protein
MCMVNKEKSIPCFLDNQNEIDGCRERQRIVVLVMGIHTSNSFDLVQL